MLSLVSLLRTEEEKRESLAKSPLQVKMDCDGADGLGSRETYEGVGRLQTRGDMRGRRALEGEGGGSWL